MEQSMTEKVIMELVVNSGNARSLAMEAIRLAKEGSFAEAEEMLQTSKDAILKAHEFQTELVSKEAAGEKGRNLSDYVPRTGSPDDGNGHY